MPPSLKKTPSAACRRNSFRHFVSKRLLEVPGLRLVGASLVRLLLWSGLRLVVLFQSGCSYARVCVSSFCFQSGCSKSRVGVWSVLLWCGCSYGRVCVWSFCFKAAALMVGSAFGLFVFVWARPRRASRVKPSLPRASGSGRCPLAPRKAPAFNRAVFGEAPRPAPRPAFFIVRSPCPIARPVGQAPRRRRQGAGCGAKAVSLAAGGFGGRKAVRVSVRGACSGLLGLARFTNGNSQT